MFVAEKGPLADTLGGGTKAFERLQAEKIPLKRARYFVKETDVSAKSAPPKKKQEEKYKEKDPNSSETRQKNGFFSKEKNYFTDSSIILSLEQTKGKISWSN